MAYCIESFKIPIAAKENSWSFPKNLKRKYSPAYMMVWATKGQGEH